MNIITGHLIQPKTCFGERYLTRDTRRRLRVVERTADLYLRNQSKLPLAKGKDRYGYYFDFTGNEEEGSCFWCAAETKYRYCSEEHGQFYRKHYNWLHASRACIDRYTLADNTTFCADCNFASIDIAPFVVHHIFPLDGEDRNWHILNQPKNLVLLCRSCHMKRHVQFNYLIRKADEWEKEIKERESNPQLAFQFMYGRR